MVDEQCDEPKCSKSRFLMAESLARTRLSPAFGLRKMTMSIRFLFVLIAYLGGVAACHSANSLLSVGLLNTATLAILLFAAIVVFSRQSPTHFFTGFLLFFGGLNALYFFSLNGAPMRQFTLADFLGQLFRSWMSNTPLDSNPRFTDYAWYGYLSHCFLATLFGIGGGLLATATCKNSRDVVDVKVEGNNSSPPESRS
jgi:hypothetical protein